MKDSWFKSHGCDRNHSVIASLTVKNVDSAIDFYKRVFDAKVSYKLTYNDVVYHCEIVIGNTIIYIMDDMPNMPVSENMQNSPFALYAYVNDPDSALDRAVKLGAQLLYPMKTEFYGDRTGTFIDPFGFTWIVARHVKDVSASQIENELPKYVKQMGYYINHTNNTSNLNNTNQTFRKKYLKYKNKYLMLRENKQ